jgi:hypothetical protein
METDHAAAIYQRDALFISVPLSRNPLPSLDLSRKQRSRVAKCVKLAVAHTAVQYRFRVTNFFHGMLAVLYRAHFLFIVSPNFGSRDNLTCRQSRLRLDDRGTMVQFSAGEIDFPLFQRVQTDLVSTEPPTRSAMEVK